MSQPHLWNVPLLSVSLHYLFFHLKILSLFSFSSNHILTNISGCMALHTREQSCKTKEVASDYWLSMPLHHRCKWVTLTNPQSNLDVTHIMNFYFYMYRKMNWRFDTVFSWTCTWSNFNLENTFFYKNYWKLTL